MTIGADRREQRGRSRPWLLIRIRFEWFGEMAPEIRGAPRQHTLGAGATRAAVSLARYHDRQLLHTGTSAMTPPATMHTGPLGSTIHVLRADADTITQLAAIDWNRHFRRVCLDPVRGLTTLMSPSHPHEDLTGVLDRIVDAVARIVRRRQQASVRVREEATAYPAHRGERGPRPGFIKPANRPL